MQGLVSLHRLPRTLRALQADLSMSTTPLFHPLRVRRIEPDTSEAVIVTFEVPPELRDVFGFTQGQYLTLRCEVEGQDLRRSYSICAGVDDGELRVGVRKVNGGVFSNWINEHLKAGDRLQVMAPQGRFFVPIDGEARRHYVGIAGGSGITPILSIMKTVLGREPRSRFTLIYGNRALKSTMFKEEIEDLKNKYLTRLVLHHVFSDEHTDAQSRMLGWSLRNSISRRRPSRMIVTLAISASPGCAWWITAPTACAACGAMPKRSMWMRSSGTPAASSAASASSFIWKGPQM
jgi:ferredoxin-NADP reductase